MENWVFFFNIFSYPVMIVFIFANILFYGYGISPSLSFIIIAYCLCLMRHFCTDYEYLIIWRQFDLFLVSFIHASNNKKKKQ